MADIRFRTPRKADDKQWKKVAFLFQHGFYFQKVYRQISHGTFQRVPYPKDLAEARRFVIDYKSQAIPPYPTLQTDDCEEPRRYPSKKRLCAAPRSR